ncbi:hypothetical protein BRD00_11060 [Halobacteriales archaeon QS_8_69_26]|nr:MAG: hypothetical protein BRD00_11060 [Halobacteriales archaeon QS_8_69_26]
MLRTDPALYEVVGRQNNHLWLEVLEGDDQGIRVSVPIHDTDYDEGVQDRVLGLSAGNVRELVLESDTEQRPNWRIRKIEDPGTTVAVQQ